MAQFSQNSFKIEQKPLDLLGLYYECGLTITARDAHADKSAFGFDGYGLGDKVSVHVSCVPAELRSATNVKLNQVSEKPGAAQ